MACPCSQAAAKASWMAATWAGPATTMGAAAPSMPASRSRVWAKVDWPPTSGMKGLDRRALDSGQSLTPQLARELNATSKAGVVLVEVDPDGPAEDAGPRRGDILIEANREPIRSVDDLQRILANVPSGGDVLLRIERVIGGNSTFNWVPVTLE